MVELNLVVQVRCPSCGNWLTADVETMDDSVIDAKCADCEVTVATRTSLTVSA